MTRPDKPERRAMFTTNGMQVPLLAVSDTYLAAAKAHAAVDFRAHGEPIEPPAYEVTLAGGTIERYPHDETTLEVKVAADAADPEAAALEADRQTAANRAAWKAHKDAVERLERAGSAASTRAMLEMGIELELPEDDAWLKRQRRAHIEIPEDPDDRRYHWLTSEVLVSFDDLMNAIQGITELTYKGAVKEEDIAAAMDTFRGQLQGQTTGVLAASRRRAALAVQRAAGRAADGQGLEPHADGIPGPADDGPGGDGGSGANAEPDGGPGGG